MAQHGQRLGRELHCLFAPPQLSMGRVKLIGTEAKPLFGLHFCRSPHAPALPEKPQNNLRVSSGLHPSLPLLSWHNTAPIASDTREKEGGDAQQAVLCCPRTTCLSR